VYDGVGKVSCTEYGINRACRNAYGAANAGFFIYARYARGRRYPVSGVYTIRAATQQAGQCRNQCIAAGSALINIRFVIYDGFCIGSATGVTALGALGLRQH